MRLTELKPRWTTFSHAADGIDVTTGITFLCPHCLTQRLGIAFRPPIDKVGLMASLGIEAPYPDAPIWDRQGDTFENLTLNPSINAENNRIDFPNHWHGFITNGEVT
jgi:hypothetical protein